MGSLRPTLVVMVRAPVAGRVKTRLARTIGPVEAVRFARSVTAGLLRRVGRDPRWRTILAVAPDRAAEAGFWPRWVARRPQGGGDLGARMQRLVADGPPGPVVIVGSDIPGIRAADIAAAFRVLGRREAAFGPAEDGGYWLVGARRRPRRPDFFRDVRWSSPHALADTLRNLAAPAGFVRSRADVDDEAGWRRWRRGAGGAGGPRPGDAA
ncbi:Phosphoenolpyruvate guanylyltransferase [Methylobacterium crusticola]|uniref:Phosphoenolpyruvate guanylyltransferase n=1 Tax=Methylobacterium crusticola TaxID=1697972 RepID=A0ABQ4QU12_9HYPH|nr:TIGR04282 family arsenosugar biosynthesis glycosyltransferase [Methylobacterium crusticola]GJD48067.1 Phosphoenolpyruvate guanylyltransferase [Methylobacterium crusticola]